MRTLAVFSAVVGVALTSVGGAAAPAAERLSCRSGDATYERYGVQIREVQARGARDGTIFGCSRGRSRPSRLWFLESGITTDTGVYARWGDRLAINFRYEADSGGGTVPGWWNLRTGQAEFAELSLPGQDFSPPVEAIAVGPDGEIAVAMSHLGQDDEPDGWDIVYRPFADGKFGRERRLPRLGLDELDPRSLRVDGRQLEWRAVGTRRSAISAAASGFAASSQGRVPRGLDCLDGDTLYGDDDARIFRVRRPASRRGVFACRRARRARPVRISREPVLLDLFERRGARIAFAVRSRKCAVGWFHATAGRVAVAAAPVRSVAAIALDPRTGGLAYLGEDADGLRVGYRPSDGRGLGADQLLARLALTEIVPHTLATSGGEVSWRAPGEARSAVAPAG